MIRLMVNMCFIVFLLIRFVHYSLLLQIDPCLSPYHVVVLPSLTHLFVCLLGIAQFLFCYVGFITNCWLFNVHVFHELFSHSDVMKGKYCFHYFTFFFITIINFHCLLIEHAITVILHFTICCQP